MPQRTGSKELSFRIGRFPGRGTGSLWASVYLEDAAYGAGAYDLQLGEKRGATPVENDHAHFEVRGATTARCERWGLSSAFAGNGAAQLDAHATLHPPVGRGEHPIRLEASFEAWHAPVYPRSRRLEMMGAVQATVETPAGASTFTGVGGWHEQVGDRAPR